MGHSFPKMSFAGFLGLPKGRLQSKGLIQMVRILAAVAGPGEVILEVTVILFYIFPLTLSILSTLLKELGCLSLL